MTGRGGRRRQVPGDVHGETTLRAITYASAALLCLLTLTSPSLAQQQRSRLVVTNKTGATVELFLLVRDAWQSRGRISPGSSLPVYDVANGQCFRAVWGSQAKELIVKLVYDRAYGGWQQVWELPGKDPSQPCRPPGVSKESSYSSRSAAAGSMRRLPTAAAATAASPAVATMPTTTDSTKGSRGRTS